MAYLVDADRLIEEFAQSDGRMPLIVFTMLSIYLDEGPFEFDAARLAERMGEINLKARVNAEEMASLQPMLERFFEPNAAGWRPREGILAPPYENEGGFGRGDAPGEHPFA